MLGSHVLFMMSEQRYKQTHADVQMALTMERERANEIKTCEHEQEWSGGKREGE